MSNIDVPIDLYLSDQWRMHGGPTNRLAREELRDRLLPEMTEAFGSVDSGLDLLLKEVPRPDGYRIRNLIKTCERFSLRKRREALESNNRSQAETAAEFAKRFNELYEMEQKLLGPGVSESDHVRALLRTDLCRLPDGTASALAPGMGRPRKLRKRGRRADEARHRAIQAKLQKYEPWRDHLPEIFEELDGQEVPLGQFLGQLIDIDGRQTKVCSWTDLDLAAGDDRRRIIDTLRKYARN